MPTITPLPSPPSTSDPVNFSNKADAHILALQTFTTEVNAFGSELAGAGIITPDRDSIVATIAGTDLWTNSKVQDWTGTPTITDFPDAPSPGIQRVAYPSAGTIIKNNANISVQGNADYTVASGDELTITAVTTSTFYVTIKRKDGTAVTGVTLSYLTGAEYKTGTDTTKILNAATARANNIVAGTSISASGTSVDFTGIPSWVKRITLMFDEFSTNGSSNYLVQIGDSGGIENTGYKSASGANGGTVAAYTTGFGIIVNMLSANFKGVMVLSCMDAATNTWVAFGSGVRTDTTLILNYAGSKSLSATLDRIRITTVNGTDVIDSGTLNFLYE